MTNRKNTRQKSIYSHINDSKQNSSRLIDKVNKLKKLDKILGKVLPKNMKQHFHVANFSDKQLTISSESANWATHLRYLMPQILLKLREHPDFKNVKDIRYLITSESVINDYKEKEKLPISKSNSQLIEKIACNIKHKELKQALIKLAKKNDSQ